MRGNWAVKLLLGVVLLVIQGGVQEPKPEVKQLLDQAKASRDVRKFDEALSLAQSALAKARELKDTEGEGQAQYSIAKTYTATNRFRDVIATCDIAIELFKQTGNVGLQAYCQSEAGRAYYSISDLAKARERFELALPLYKQAGNRDSEAGTMMNIAIITENLGDPAAALKVYDTIRPIFRELGRKDSEATLLANMGLANGKLGDYEKELDLLKQALAIDLDLGRLNYQLTGYKNIAITCQNLLRYNEAHDALEKAQAVAKQLNNPLAEASVESITASLEKEEGKWHSAKARYERILPTFIKYEDKRNERDVCDNLAIISSRFGEHEKALKYFERALALDRERGYRFGEMKSLINLGWGYTTAGQGERALPIFREALKLTREFKSTNDEARALGGLGSALEGVGRSDEAMRNHLAALAIFEKNNDKASMAAVCGNIAVVEGNRRNQKAKLKYSERSLELFTAVGDKHGIANMNSSLGDTLLEGKQWAAAAKRYQTAAKVAREAGNRDFEASALHGLAKAQKQLGKKKEAQENLRQAINLLEGLRADFGGLTEAQAGFLSSKVHIYYAFLDSLLGSGSTAVAFEVAQKTKARSLLDVLAAGRVDIRAGMTDAEKEKESDLRQQADSLNQQMVREGVVNEVGAKKRYEVLKEQLKVVENELTAYSESLRLKYPQIAARRSGAIATAADVTKSLPAGTALLEYVAVSSKRIALFVIANGKTTGYEIPVNYDALAKQASDFRAACSNPKRKDWSGNAAKLYKTLIAPAAKQIAGSSRVIVCPDGALWDVPFQVLMPSSNRFLADDFDVSYSSSASALLKTLGEKRAKVAAGSLLVFANPDFGSVMRFAGNSGIPGQRPFDTPSRPIDQPSRPIDLPSRPFDQPSRPMDIPSRAIDSPSRAIDLPSRGGKIASLPGTQREADAIARDFRDSDIFTKGDAQESIAKRIAGNYRYLHFATHGYVNDAAPMLSSVVLAAPAKSSKDDGFLTARELAELDLQGTMMVTLSACNTARGNRRSGEGVIGLTWALGVAGVKTQVVSQWSVDDASTATLMERFYAGLSKGTQKGAALRNAAKLLRADGKHGHPYYWAPFVLLGDWR